MNTFIQRALVALTLGPVLLVAAYFGGWIYFIPVTVLLVLATIEYSQLTYAIASQNTGGAKLGQIVSPWLLVPGVVGLLAAAQFSTQQTLGLVLLVGLVLTLGYALWAYEQGWGLGAIYSWLGLWTGLLLLGWVSGHFFLLRNLGPDGWRWVALAMVSNWTADSGAYLTGTFLAGKVIGRHQLSPRLSPKKTVEGFVGSILAGLIAAAVVAMLLDLPLGLALLIGLLIAMISPIGDLGISLLKRQAGVKDSGKLFPGHGGALDRLDSLIWAVALAYYLVLFLIE